MKKSRVTTTSSRWERARPVRFLPRNCPRPARKYSSSSPGDRTMHRSSRQCLASLEELSYALDVLGLDGFVLFTNSNGVYLGDPALEPVFEELERRKNVVYVHPNPSPDAVAHSLGLPDNLLDFPTDTNRAVAQMHYTNRFARTPNVKYIFSHAGGSIPFLAARFAIIDEMGFIAGGEQRGLIFSIA